MESTASVSPGARVSKILINRKRFWKNTIHVNPRILKSSSGDITQHKTDGAHVSLGCMGSSINPDLSKVDKFHDVQRSQLRVAGSYEANESFPAASNCVYLNPHFQRTAPSSVHINPKKFSRIMEQPNNLLVNTQPSVSKQESKASEVPKSSISSFGSINPVCDSKNVRCGAHTGTYPVASVHHHNLSAANKKWNHFCVDTAISAKQVENTSLMKKVTYNKLVRISDTKLVRIPDKTKSWCVNRALQKVLINQQCQAVKKYPEVHDVKTIKKKSEKRKKSSYTQSHCPSFSPAVSTPDKYKLSKKILPVILKKGKPDLLTSPSCSPSKYKIDRRLIRSRLLRNYRKASIKYENSTNNFHRKNVAPKCSLTLPVLYRGRNSSTRKLRFSDGKKIVISSRKLLRIGSTMKTKEQRRKKDQTPHSTRLIRIGGVFYKTSRTKLTRSRTPITTTKQPVVKRHKTDKSRTIYIRGSKFIMDAMGKTLRQVPQKMSDNCKKDGKSVALKRVDIGGITFVQKSSNLLVRTNTHTARNIVNHAKNKSIAMLTNKLRKINQPCAFYHRFGKCPRKDKGMCQLVHDPKQIAVCKRFLQGECNIDNCLLSHQIVPEKMPTCKYFLEGCCIRENCPYLHVKLNSKAVVCKNFLQGYCAEGSRCKKRHSYVCPDYEKYGTCQKGKYCPYPHKTSSKLNEKTVSKQAKQMKPDHSSGDLSRKRYYQGDKMEEKDSCLPEEHLQKLQNITHAGGNRHCNIEESASDHEEPVLKRPRIGRLPSFIALGH